MPQILWHRFFSFFQKTFLLFDVPRLRQSDMTLNLIIARNNGFVKYNLGECIQSREIWDNLRSQ